MTEPETQCACSKELHHLRNAIQALVMRVHLLQLKVEKMLEVRP